MPFAASRTEAVPLQLAQLDHASWTTRDGAPTNIGGMLQDKNGTLWISAQSGLFTFDGKGFSPFKSRQNEPQLPSVYIDTMYMANDGTLWVGFVTPLIAEIRNHRVVRLYDEKDGLLDSSVSRIFANMDGKTMAITRGRLFELDGGRWQDLNAEPARLGEEIRTGFCDHTGTLWLVTPTSIWKRPAGQTHFVRTQEHGGWAATFTESPEGVTWIYTTTPAEKNSKPGEQDFLHRLPQDGAETSSRKLGFDIFGLFSDVDGYLWFTTLFGVVRVDPTHWPTLDTSQWVKAAMSDDSHPRGFGFERFGQLDGLTSDKTGGVLQDSAGDIWVGTAKGLDRFRSPHLVRLMDKRVSNPQAVVSQCPGRDLWLGTDEGPLVSMHDGELRPHGPMREPLWLYCDPEGTVWLSDNAGLFKYHGDEIEHIAPPAGIPALFNRQVVGDAHRLFVSFTRNGLWRLQGGIWSRVKVAGFPDETPTSLLIDKKGRLWAGHLRGFIGMLDGDVGRVYRTDSEISLGVIQVLLETSFGLAVGGSNGIAILRGDHLQVLSVADQSATQGVSGLLQAPNGDFWVNALHGIARIRADEVLKALQSPTYSMRSEYIGDAGNEGPAPQLFGVPTAVVDSDGLFWFATSNAVLSVDPASVRPSVTPPILSGLSMTIDGKPLASNGQVSPGYHTARIKYLGAYITAPERVTYKYKLNGADEAWQEVGDRSEAVYTGLRPGAYRFAVMASNGEGTWSQPDESLRFTVLPSFYQRPVFLLLCVTTALILLWIVYRLRMRQLVAMLRERELVRTDERDRIARDLHDTLLQGIQGLTLQFHVATQELPKGSRTRQALENALTLADRLQKEGRNRVRGLRERALTSDNLVATLEAFAGGLNIDNKIRVAVTTEGRLTDVAPLVLQELHSIAQEAVTNAFRHSQATEITVKLRGLPQSVVLVVTDNGRGFDVSDRDVTAGDGHWGIHGMKERAQTIGASFECLSTPNAGTQVIVTAPSNGAYTKHSNPFSRN